MPFDSNVTVAFEPPMRRSTFAGALAPLGIVGVTWTYMDTVLPCITELGTCLNATASVGSGGGGGGDDELGDGSGVPGSELAELLGLDEGDLLADVEGDGEVVDASAAGAVPLARTRPVPTLMISGLRTDRASTADNLLRRSPLILTPWLTPWVR